jgi:DNA-binding NarL/FixJ family response regulator
VLLADDHPMMLEGLKRLLEPRFEVIGAVADGRALLEIAQRRRPDLVIADLSMPGIDGIEATRRLHAAVPGVRVLILSIHTEPSWVRGAFEAGACGYLTKSAAPEEIERAAREVLGGRFYVSPAAARAALFPASEGDDGFGRERRGETVSKPHPARLVRGAPPAPDQALTRRELEIVGLVGLGLGNREIARRLGVAVTTVRSHLASVYEKLGLSGRIELALYAAQAGVGHGRVP